MTSEMFNNEPTEERKAKLEQLLGRMEAPDVIAKQCQMSHAAVFALINARSYTGFNKWWAQQVSGRRAMLINDKWALAEAAYSAGREALAEEIAKLRDQPL